MHDKEIVFIDLFAGLGGFHFALEELGCVCAFSSELKEDLRKLYSINFPGCRIEGDITKIEPKDIPEHYVLFAGFPCPSASNLYCLRGTRIWKIVKFRISGSK